MRSRLLSSSGGSWKPAVTNVEQVYRIISQKVACMYSNSGSALSKIKAIATVPRAEGNVDLDDISVELEHRARVQKQLSPSTVASASVGSMGSELRKPSFPSDMAGEFLTYWCKEELRSLAFLRACMERLARSGLEESDAYGGGEVGDGINQA